MGRRIRLMGDTAMKSDGVVVFCDGEVGRQPWPGGFVEGVERGGLLHAVARGNKEPSSPPGEAWPIMAHGPLGMHCKAGDAVSCSAASFDIPWLNLEVHR